MRRFLVPVGVLAAVVVALVVAELLSGSSPSSKPRPAPPLPPGVLVPPKQTLATLHGAPAFVTFWASWCDPCKKEAPDLERFSRSLGTRGKLIGVDYTDGINAARSFIRDQGWTFPILSDPEGIYGDRFGLTGLPTTAVLDSRGMIVELLRGPQTIASLREALATVSRHE
jgi:thiol-disulfide isomerase/thioredoxin